MLKSRAILVTVLAAVAAGFVFGIVSLFQLQFSSGDIYPPYSSLRTDPLGAKIFCESLRRLPGLTVSRFFQPDSKLYGSRHRALFVVGASAAALQEMSPDDYHALQNFLYEGGRVIVSLLPGNENVTQPEEKKTKTKTPSRSATNDDDFMAKPISFLSTNALTIKSESLAVEDSGATHPELAEASAEFPALPRLISWHSAEYFSPSNSQWRVVYSRKEHPVIIERSFGEGSLVLSTDSYFVSNEAMRKERHSELLVWLLGGRHEILFDETHFGVMQQLGVAALMRRYRLEGAIAALIFLAGLFIWKNSASLAPMPPEGPAGYARVAGKDSSAGFASLLRRNVPVGELILTSFEEWKTACARDPRVSARMPAIQSIIDEEKARPPGSRRPLETYQAIRRILTKRNYD